MVKTAHAWIQWARECSKQTMTRQDERVHREHDTVYTAFANDTNETARDNDGTSQLQYCVQALVLCNAQCISATNVTLTIQHWCPTPPSSISRPKSSLITSINSRLHLAHSHRFANVVDTLLVFLGALLSLTLLSPRLDGHFHFLDWAHCSKYVVSIGCIGCVVVKRCQQHHPLNADCRPLNRWRLFGETSGRKQVSITKDSRLVATENFSEQQPVICCTVELV